MKGNSGPAAKLFFTRLLNSVHGPEPCAGISPAVGRRGTPAYAGVDNNCKGVSMDAGDAMEGSRPAAAAGSFADRPGFLLNQTADRSQRWRAAAVLFASV